jgi:hypothetical protein
VLIIPIVEIVKVIQRAVDKSHREKEEAAEKRAKKRD